MKNLASTLTIVSLWFLSLIGIGFIARSMYELVMIGWRSWP